MNTQETYMKEALTLAAQAAEHMDIPVGCVIVKDGEIIGQGRNRRELLGDATAHAEVEAIRDACQRLGTWRLTDCTLYVTLEPCPMCAGAIINARIGRVVYGASNAKSGCCGSVLPLFQEGFNHRPEVLGGVLESDCSEIMTIFFNGK